MVFEADHYQELAQDLHERGAAGQSGKRGDHRPERGRAGRKPHGVHNIGDPQQVTDPDRVVEVLSRELEMDPGEVRGQGAEGVFHGADPDQCGQRNRRPIRDCGLDGVKVDEDYKRYYPYDDLASRVLGFTGGDNQGIIGLEVKYEEYLKGRDGTILTVTDARGVELSGVAEDRIEPVPGQTLQVSLDYNIQSYCQQAAEKVLCEKQAEAVSVILMDPGSGEIYAMVNAPEFNLNEPFELNTGRMRTALFG